MIAPLATLAMSVIIGLGSHSHCATVSYGSIHSLSTVPEDKVEATAKLLIVLDQMIEAALESEPSLHHFYLAPEAAAPFNPGSNVDREERFSIVLQDLSKIEEHIKEAINKANSNRQYRLVMRLRPLLSYVNHIHRNMEMLRTRVVAIATLSNLAVNVNEVLDQFSDVMTSSMSLSTGIVPNPNPMGRPVLPHAEVQVHNLNPEQQPPVTALANEPVTTASTTQPSRVISTNAPLKVTTFPSAENVDAENFFKNILSAT